MITKEFSQLFKKTILHNKRLMYCSILITIMAYGFTITNFSIGVDDFASNHYLHTNGWGSMIQQGRLAHVLIEKLFGVVTFVPFLNDFIGAFLFFCSALFFCGFFQYIVDGKLSSYSLIVFTGLYLSFSIVNEKFIYNLDVIVTMLSYLAIAYALLCTYEYIYKRGKQYFLFAVLGVILGVSSYESFAFVFLCGACAIPILKMVVMNERVTLRDFFIKGWNVIVILGTALISYYALVVVVQLATDQFGLFGRGMIWRNGEPFINNVVQVLRKFQYSMTKFSYLPILEFAWFSIAGFMLFTYYAWKRKRGMIWLSFLFLFLANFGIHVVVGEVMYRAAQTFCFFIGFVGLFVVYFLEHHPITKKLGYLAAAAIIMLQLFDLNQWFYFDYSRYKKEEFVIHAIATRLVSECDVSKPVVFTNRPKYGYLEVMNSNNQVNGMSLVYRGIAGFGEIQSPDMIHLFQMHGYNFLVKPTLEQAQKALELSVTMEAWPKQGSIQELDEFIVVNFSTIQDPEHSS